MNSSKKLAAILGLAISAGLAGAGCMAQRDDVEEITDGQDQAAAPSEQASDPSGEKTGTASEKCGGGFGCGGFGGCGGCGGAFQSPYWGGPIFVGCGLEGFGCAGFSGFNGCFGSCW